MPAEQRTSYSQKLLFGGVFAFFGVTFILAGFEDPTRPESTAYKYMGVGFLLLMPIYYIVIYKMRQKRLEARSRQILYDFLAKNNYKCTVVEFAVASGLEPDEARTILDEVATKSGVSTEISDSGIVIYKFK